MRCVRSWPMWIEAPNPKKLLLFCFWSAIEVPLKRHWRDIEVLLKCYWSAFEAPLKCQQPKATATHLPLPTPLLSIVGLSKTAHLKNHEKKPELWSLKEGVSGWSRQTDGHGDSMTDPDQRAESVKIPHTGDTKSHRAPSPLYSWSLKALYAIRL